MFKKYQFALDCCSMRGWLGENWTFVAGKADGALDAGCGQGQPFLPQSPSQSFFFSFSPCDLQQLSASFLTSFLQQFAPVPQAKAAVVGIAEKANTNRNGSDMAVKKRIMWRIKRENNWFCCFCGTNLPMAVLRNNPLKLWFNPVLIELPRRSPKPCCPS